MVNEIFLLPLVNISFLLRCNGEMLYTIYLVGVLNKPIGNRNVIGTNFDISKCYGIADSYAMHRAEFDHYITYSLPHGEALWYARPMWYAVVGCG